MKKYLLATVTEVHGESEFQGYCLVVCDASKGLDEIQDELAKTWRGAAEWSEPDNFYWCECGTSIAIPELDEVTSEDAVVLAKYLTVREL